ncbi:phosphatase PAP2 family protein [Vibrio rotiferianus]|uniref:phosphatase PAP2 family protein n=1 Tax=Vibrio rotiferianus TaxID=190895 RepID=UPI00339557D5
MKNECVKSEVNLSKKLNKFLSGIYSNIKNDSLIYYFIIISSTITYIISFFSPGGITFSFFTYLGILGISMFVFLNVWGVYYYFYLLFKLEPHPLKAFFYKAKTSLTPINRTLYILFLIISVHVTFSSFTYLKSIIPFIHNFKYDALFSDIDRLLHFGIDPWIITHTIFSSPWMTLIINIFYNLWFFYFLGLLIYFIFSQSNPKLRLQFILSFLSCWMIFGALFATLLSSAGPCFYEVLLDDARYGLLMERLHSQNDYISNYTDIPLWALGTQESLWNDYVNSESGVGSGISAMPSMHVSIAAICALALYQVKKLVGIFAWIFTAIIQIGSVHLAWHYAIDGYASIIITILLWKVVGRYLETNKKPIQR